MATPPLSAVMTERSVADKEMLPLPVVVMLLLFTTEASIAWMRLLLATAAAIPSAPVNPEPLPFAPAPAPAMASESMVTADEAVTSTFPAMVRCELSTYDLTKLPSAAFLPNSLIVMPAPTAALSDVEPVRLELAREMAKPPASARTVELSLEVRLKLPAVTGLAWVPELRM